MRACPLICEWFRGCPNRALIYYAFSDKWLCDYCIRYARIGVPTCAQDGWKQGVCVDAESQGWFCSDHARQCASYISRPPGRHTGNVHKCLQRAIRRESDGCWYCLDHAATQANVLQLDNPGHRIVRQADHIDTATRPLRPVASRRTSPPPRSNHIATQLPPRVASSVIPPAIVTPRLPGPYPRPSYAGSSALASNTRPGASRLLTRIANAISTLSSVLLTPEHNTSVDSIAVNHDRHLMSPWASPLMNLDLFSTLVDTECSICLESHGSMRRLVVCGHMFCADCLTKQVTSRHVRASSCALCRQDMFEGTELKTF